MEIDFINKKIYGKKITQARRYRALNIKELSDLLNLYEFELKEFENDEKIPSNQIILKLSEILNLPIAYFYDNPSDDKENNKYNIYFCKIP